MTMSNPRARKVKSIAPGPVHAETMLSTCIKVPYKTSADATRAHPKFTPYRCKLCGAWHLTSKRR